MCPKRKVPHQNSGIYKSCVHISKPYRPFRAIQSNLADDQTDSAIIVPVSRMFTQSLLASLHDAYFKCVSFFTHLASVQNAPSRPGATDNGNTTLALVNSLTAKSAIIMKSCNLFSQQDTCVRLLYAIAYTG